MENFRVSDAPSGFVFHDKGIVTITSESVYDSAMRKEEQGQWIRWDYTIKSWVVDGSLDGVNWAEIDRKTDNDD
jgi:hypothetical protein